MLKTTVAIALFRASRTLHTLAKEPTNAEALAACAECAAAIDAHLGAQQAALAKAAATRERRGAGYGKRAGGRPPSAFIVDTEPGPEYVVWGAQAACDKAEAIAREHREKWVVGVQTLHNAMSRAGYWWRTIETDAGTITVSIKRASPEREAAERDTIAESLSGTKDAS